MGFLVPITNFTIPWGSYYCYIAIVYAYIAVEQVDDGASLHGLSVGNHHICVLLKMLVSYPHCG